MIRKLWRRLRRSGEIDALRDEIGEWGECLGMVRGDLEGLGMSLDATPPYSTNDAVRAALFRERRNGVLLAAEMLRKGLASGCYKSAATELHDFAMKARKLEKPECISRPLQEIGESSMGSFTFTASGDGLRRW